MNNNKILSIIIPTYNVADYLETCLKSFENEELIELIEVIVVNDGSTDNSSKIAEKFKRKYPNSYYLLNKENGGHGSTINYGLKNANGKYFMIVDGDDWIEADNLLKICKFLMSDDSYDAVFYNCVVELKYKNKRRKRTLKKIFNIGKINMNKSKVSIYNQIGLSNTIYKTTNLRKINLKLLEKTFYVDAEYMLYPMQTLVNCYYFDLTVYHYLIGRPSQSTNLYTALSRIDDRMRVIKNIVNYFKEKDKFDNFSLMCYYSKTASIINDYYELLIRGCEDYNNKIKEFDNYIFDNDKQLFYYMGNHFFYIRIIRKRNYSKKGFVFYYIINKIINYMKKR